MAVADPEGAHAAGADAADGFLEHAHLTYFVPFATDFRADDALRDGAGPVESRLAAIEQRDQLFFGTRDPHAAPAPPPLRPLLPRAPLAPCSFAACR